MCLYTSQKKPSVSKNDTTCYKVLEKDMFGTYRSTYRPNYEWKPFGETNYPYGKDNKELCCTDCPNLGDYYSLGSGWLHTFPTLQEAKALYQVIKGLRESRYNAWQKVPSTELVVVKCKIPKGVEYYKGTSLCEWIETKSYCSRELVLVKEVKL